MARQYIGSLRRKKISTNDGGEREIVYPISQQMFMEHPVHVRPFMQQILTIWSGPLDIYTQKNPSGSTGTCDVPDEWYRVELKL
jgi:hypothetical protein